MNLACQLGVQFAVATIVEHLEEHQDAPGVYQYPVDVYERRKPGILLETIKVRGQVTKA